MVGSGLGVVGCAVGSGGGVGVGVGGGGGGGSSSTTVVTAARAVGVGVVVVVRTEMEATVGTDVGTFDVVMLGRGTGAASGLPHPLSSRPVARPAASAVRAVTAHRVGPIAVIGPPCAAQRRPASVIRLRNCLVRSCLGVPKT